MADLDTSSYQCVTFPNAVQLKLEMQLTAARKQ